MGLQGGDFITSRISQQFGLDQISVESENKVGGGSLVFGKYLTPNLYVSYGLGLFQSTDVVKLKYVINKNWSIQAEGGENTGSMIIYSLER